MNVLVLVLGSGAREHALVWKLSRDPSVKVMAAGHHHFEGHQPRSDIGAKALAAE